MTVVAAAAALRITDLPCLGGQGAAFAGRAPLATLQLRCVTSPNGRNGNCYRGTSKRTTLVPPAFRICGSEFATAALLITMFPGFLDGGMSRSRDESIQLS